MGCRQYLSLSVVQVKVKHCRKPHCRNGAVDTFRQGKLITYCPNVYTVVAGAEVPPVPLYDEIAARTCLFPKAFPLSAFTTTEGQKGQAKASAAKEQNRRRHYNSV